jgi:hypothetical protein
MDAEKALQIVSRQAPCPHETLDTRMGDGTTWARCEDCGVTIAREDLPAIRKRAIEFEEAVDTLRAAVVGCSSSSSFIFWRTFCMILPSPKGYITDDTQEYRYEVAPLGQKVLLLTMGGVCTIGQWSGTYGQFFWGWAPLPKRNKQREEALGLSPSLQKSPQDTRNENGSEQDQAG